MCRMLRNVLDISEIAGYVEGNGCGCCCLSFARMFESGLKKLFARMFESGLKKLDESARLCT